MLHSQPVPISRQQLARHDGRPSTRPNVLAQMISSKTNSRSFLKTPMALMPKKPAHRNMEGQISKTSKRRKECDDRYSHLTARRNEITELHECFELLDAQYTNDNQTLVAIEESGSSL
jgi:hypothetical protein